MTHADFRKYYDALYMPLCMYALRMLDDTAEADDVVQQAFVNVWTKCADSPPPSNMKAYLYMSVRNLALMQLRHSGRLTSLTDEEMNTRIDDEAIDTSERDAAVWQAIGRLPEKCRQVFLLSKRDGLSYAEIAAEMGISVKTVENQMTKALRRLRDTLSAHPGKIFFLPFL